MDQIGVSTCHQNLKQCFHTLETNHKAWNSVLTECTPLVSSLGNLGEQLRALDNVQVGVTQLHHFPDLQERLRFKLLQAVDVVLGKLTDKMDELQKLLKTLSNQVSTVFQFYEQNTDTLDLATCTLRSATSPSIADMLEWLQDANSYYRQQYPYLSNAVGMQIPCMISLTWQGGQLGTCMEYLVTVYFSSTEDRFLRRKHLLQVLRPDDLSLVEEVPKRWESVDSPDGEEHISDTLSRVSFFVDS